MHVASIFVLLINGVLSFQKCDSNDNRKIYDFIIIGGGTAGCLLATRLSENNHFTVLLLEAGGKPPINAKVPMLSRLLFDTKYDWNYTTIPQTNAYLWSPNNQSKWHRGKMLGGSSSMNSVNFIRGNKRDFDLWEKNGSQGWSWEKVLPYFLKVENANIDNFENNNFGHIPLTKTGDKSPFILTFMKGMKKMGYLKSDPNDGYQFGYDYTPLSVLNKERVTTFTHYLKPVLECRENLEVKTFSFVEKILFNKHKEAIGVVHSQNGCKKKVFVKKEIILSAGAVNSPQLLMLTGIGPKHHLEKFDIKVVADSPVGDNLQDHIYVPFTFTGKYESIFIEKAKSQFFNNKTGPLAECSFAGGFINTKYCNNEFNSDIQLIAPSWVFRTHMNSDLKYLVFAVLQRPKSRGSIKLQSNNPYDHPIIDPEYLSDEKDVHVLAEGCRIVYTITNVMENNEYGFKREDLFAKECDVYHKSDAKFWHCIVKHFIITMYHPCGTCKMGSKSDASTVVDNELKVKGVKKLRVVDASIMPTIVSANFQATVMMIAEKASGIIKGEHKNFCVRESFLNLFIKSNDVCNVCN